MTAPYQGILRSADCAQSASTHVHAPNHAKTIPVSSPLVSKYQTGTRAAKTTMPAGTRKWCGDSRRTRRRAPSIASAQPRTENMIPRTMESHSSPMGVTRSARAKAHKPRQRERLDPLTRVEHRTVAGLQLTDDPEIDEAVVEGPAVRPPDCGDESEGCSQHDELQHSSRPREFSTSALFRSPHFDCCRSTVACPVKRNCVRRSGRCYDIAPLLWRRRPVRCGWRSLPSSMSSHRSAWSGSPCRARPRAHRPRRCVCRGRRLACTRRAGTSGCPARRPRVGGVAADVGLRNLGARDRFGFCVARWLLLGTGALLRAEAPRRHGPVSAPAAVPVCPDRPRAAHPA